MFANILIPFLNYINFMKERRQEKKEKRIGRSLY